jgi:hypothetical protein
MHGGWGAPPPQPPPQQAQQQQNGWPVDPRQQQR